MKKSPLRRKGKSETSKTKDRIQKLLRECVILRDKGCILRHYTEAGKCGGYRNDGELILQAEHLNTRERNISFGDLRNIVCLCLYHHGYFKQKQGALYWDLVRRHIGEKRWKWLQRVITDRKVYPMGAYEWGLTEKVLQQELQKLSTG